MIPLERIEALASATKLLLAERRKAALLSDKLATAEGARRNKLNVDLNWLAMHIARHEAKVHALAVDAGLADLREPSHYATRIARPTAWHDYTWEPEKPEALIEAQKRGVE
jgi:hypothetical protein